LKFIHCHCTSFLLATKVLMTTKVLKWDNFMQVMCEENMKEGCRVFVRMEVVGRLVEECREHS
jgi:hypothetical protein